MYRMFDRKIILLLLEIFVIALFLRYLYFPDNIYFGFDQARDGFAVKEILNGHMKLVGPSTTFEGLRHGVLYYYLYAPFYFFGGGDPGVPAASLRVLNSFGVILIFALASILFGKFTGLIAAWLFAISFEQTQFALYFNHPSFAVISILILFLGLSILIFKKEDFGLIIAFLGLGLSIQFEFLLTYLIIPFLLILIVFRKSIPSLAIKTKVFGVITFLLIISSYIVSEIKYGFRSFSGLSQLLFNGSEKSVYKIVITYLFEMGQVIKFTLVGINELKLPIGLILFIIFLFTIKSKISKQVIFLGIWFFSAMIIYFISGGGDLNVDIIQYHPNVGISLSLIIFVSYLVLILWKKNMRIAMIIIMLIFSANFYLIQKINPFGSMPEINAQSFMLLSDEEKVIDYIYLDSREQPFAVKAISLPFYVNTTWSYLFEWYGKKKYGYLPVWNGTNAAGYSGNLTVETAQDKAPFLRYLIIEPLRGIPTYLVDDYLREESYFSDVKKEIEIGKFKVQVRQKK